MNTDTLNRTRREAGITGTEFADFLGASRHYMVRVELGLEPVQSWMFEALGRMITSR